MSVNLLLFGRAFVSCEQLACHSLFKSCTSFSMPALQKQATMDISAAAPAEGAKLTDSASQGGEPVDEDEDDGGDESEYDDDDVAGTQAIATLI